MFFGIEVDDDPHRPVHDCPCVFQLIWPMASWPQTTILHFLRKRSQVSRPLIHLNVQNGITNPSSTGSLSSAFIM